MSPSRRRLVVTADDFGLCEQVNEGVADAHIHGIVTAASLMVRRQAAVAAAALSADLPRLSMGLHLDLGEWEYCEGEWQQIDFVVDVSDELAVRDAIDQQIGAFVRMVGRAPTHLDGHQHVHLSEPARSIVAATSESLGVPVRHGAAPYVGGFYGQTGTGEPRPERITTSALVAILDSLPQGLSELGCHPGRNMVAAISRYGSERDSELTVLCDPNVKTAIRDFDIELCAPGASRSVIDRDREGSMTD